MKNILVAIPLIGAAHCAFAQSSVTLFGVLDASVSGYRTESELSPADALASGNSLSAVLGAPNILKRSATKLANSAYTSSRVGFRGTEDLGGGLSAGFWLEAGISNDDGQKGIDNFNRRSTVSLSFPFGELRLGRDYAASFWNDTVFDPFGTNGVGTNVITSVNSAVAAGHGALINGFAGDNYFRVSNSVGYFLPPNLGGFYGQLQYGIHENVRQTGSLANGNRKGSYVGGRMGYAHGPLDVAASYGEDLRDDPVNGFEKDRIKVFNLGASYDFGVVKLFGEVSRLTDTHQDPIKLGSGVPGFAQSEREAKYTGALVGLTVPVGPGLVRLAYSQVKYNAPDFAGTALQVAGSDDAKTKKFAIGYVHNLSRRTALYATVARVDPNWKGTHHTAMAASVGGGVGYAPTFGSLVNAYKPRSSIGYDIGLRHAF